jgi:esterase/lipase superfamily enzyme
MNLFLKRPDLIQGVIAMSGVYDLTEYSRGFFDEQVYFNSPMHYLPNLEEEIMLENIRKNKHIHILSGSGDYEDPEASRGFSSVLHAKQIQHHLSIWGPEWRHDWTTWRAMMPGVVGFINQ